MVKVIHFTFAFYLTQLLKHESTSNRAGNISTMFGISFFVSVANNKEKVLTRNSAVLHF